MAIGIHLTKNTKEIGEEITLERIPENSVKILRVRELLLSAGIFSLSMSQMFSLN
jgi:hypothetical protein